MSSYLLLDEAYLAVVPPMSNEIKFDIPSRCPKCCRDDTGRRSGFHGHGGIRDLVDREEAAADP
jgi:hypothetical protein